MCAHYVCMNDNACHLCVGVHSYEIWSMGVCTMYVSFVRTCVRRDVRLSAHFSFCILIQTNFLPLPSFNILTKCRKQNSEFAQ